MLLHNPYGVSYARLAPSLVNTSEEIEATLRVRDRRLSPTHKVFYAKQMRWLILCTIAIAPVWLPAEVYKWVDPQGNVIYSDKPHPGAEEIKLPETQAYPAPQTASPAIKPEQQPFPGYEKIEIATPANDETIRDNTGNINVSIKLEPELQVDLGHKLVLYVDGVRLPQELTSTLFQFTNLDRGTHTIHAAVVDSAGKELVRSKPSTFHLKRFSSLLSPPATNQGSSKKR